MQQNQRLNGGDYARRHGANSFQVLQSYRPFNTHRHRRRLIEYQSRFLISYHMF